ncbi:CaiB/BaiF CoA transferase family protein [Corynebacterium kozikiae]|uniref:CaiB/BaiF CoA transferase family protein n=1 Tax=Corynebacterium kozikiae TaxID=2968469 RepID=UPI00211CD805|nr:CoA transferase [Corynebacterium sp. 76QC2CO]MCQ9343019.1 CoA transferase [Corynebacterium sp. 76QC2CO]
MNLVNHADNRPLAGLVVADFSRVLAGPYCTMLLADLGATVIKVESHAGDDTRQWMPPARDGVSTYYMSVNRNKQAIALDLSKEEDLEFAYAIIDRADIFIENFKPNGLKKFGLDKSQTLDRWPSLIHASITGFGTEGGAHLPGYDLLVQALSGFMHVTGDPDGPPTRAGVAIFDVVAGLHTTVGILAAVAERARSGKGQHVDIDLLSSTQAALVNQTTGNVACDNEPQRLGNDHPSLFPYGPFQAADGEIIICCGNNGQFRRLMEQLGQPEVADDPRFTEMALRNANREELRVLIETALRTQTIDTWFERLSSVKVPCAPIKTIGEGIRYSEQLGLNPISMAGEGEQAVPTVSSPIRLSRTPVRYDIAPPTINQDIDAVRAWVESTSARDVSEQSMQKVGG